MDIRFRLYRSPRGERRRRRLLDYERRVKLRDLFNQREMKRRLEAKANILRISENKELSQEQLKEYLEQKRQLRKKRERMILKMANLTLMLGKDKNSVESIDEGFMALTLDENANKVRKIPKIREKREKSQQKAVDPETSRQKLNKGAEETLKNKILDDYNQFALIVEGTFFHNALKLTP